MNIIFFLISFTASIIGAITGIGGGIIIKPVLDATGYLSVSSISFLSGITVLSMTTVSLLRSRKSNIKLDVRRASFLAFGGVIGGLIGKYVFDLMKTAYHNDVVVGIMQAIILLLLTVGVLYFMLNQHKFKKHELENVSLCILAGLTLGLISSFLGIGGGPINLVLLYILFSMDTKTAAINSLFIIFFSQLSSLIFTVYGGKIPEFSVWTLAVMMLGGISGGLVGSEIIKRINVKQAGKLFNVVLVVIMVICVYNIIQYMT